MIKEDECGVIVDCVVLNDPDREHGVRLQILGEDQGPGNAEDLIWTITGVLFRDGAIVEEGQFVEFASLQAHRRALALLDTMLWMLTWEPRLWRPFVDSMRAEVPPDKGAFGDHWLKINYIREC